MNKIIAYLNGAKMFIILNNKPGVFATIPRLDKKNCLYSDAVWVPLALVMVSL